MTRDPAAEGRHVGGAFWRPSELLAVPAGWGLAAAVLMPGVIAPGPAGPAAPLLALVAVLLWWVAVVAVIRSDLRDFIIPDEASLAVACLGTAVAAALPWLSGEGAVEEAALAGAQALADGAAAFALFGLVGMTFRRLGRDALGFGDVKLAGASAIWLPPGDAALALEVAALGALAMLLVSRRTTALRDTAVPFGAFLAPAAWLVFVLAPTVRDAAGFVPW